MYSLIIDSATKKLYVSLLKDNDILFENLSLGAHDHAKNIVGIINNSLNAANIKVDDLDEVITGVGPGSYTGSRLAVTVAKMFAAFKNIPLYSVSTLTLMSSGNKGKILSYIDARHGNCFGSIVDTINNKIIVEDSFILLDDLKKNEYDLIITEDDFKVDPLFVLKNKKKVDNYDLLVPNYLRVTEAERNLDDKKN